MLISLPAPAELSPERHLERREDEKRIQKALTLLSPDQGRQSCRLGCYLARRRDVPRLFAAFEQEMLALGGRPHWGKLFSASPDTLRAAVPGLARFDELRRALDPKGMFANGYVRRIFGA